MDGNFDDILGQDDPEKEHKEWVEENKTESPSNKSFRVLNDAYQKSRPKHWKPSHSTRLRDNMIIDGHDDWDCLDDLDDAGLVEIISLINGFVRMTDYGLAITALLRKHKASGGKYRDFVPFQQEG